MTRETRLGAAEPHRALVGAELVSARWYKSGHGTGAGKLLPYDGRRTEWGTGAGKLLPYDGR